MEGLIIDVYTSLIASRYFCSYVPHTYTLTSNTEERSDRIGGSMVMLKVYP